jgi:hypothetical protein
MDKIDLRTARKIANMFTTKVYSISYTTTDMLLNDIGCILGGTEVNGRADDIKNSRFSITFPRHGDEEYQEEIIRIVNSNWEDRKRDYGCLELEVNSFPEAQLYILLHEIGHICHYDSLTDEESKKFSKGLNKGLGKQSKELVTICETYADSFACQHYYKIRELLFEKKGL